MPQALSIARRFRDGITFAPVGGVARFITDDGVAVDLHTASPTLDTALHRLAEGVDEASLIATVGEDNDVVARLYYYLVLFKQRGLLVAGVRCIDGLLATLLPRSRSFDIVLPPAAGGVWKLSRFAYLRRDGEDLVLECPQASCVAQVKSADVVRWLHESCVPTNGKSGTLKASFCGLLERLGFLVNADSAEDESQQTWEFHDRVFHHWARDQQDFRSHGASYRFRNRLPMPPALRPAYDGDVLSLTPVSSPASRPLFEIMETRRSLRDMRARPVTRNQVSEILYRVARVKEALDPPMYEAMRRPFPSGGAIHELEFYLAIRACDGLAQGFYHYRGSDHSLTRLERGVAAAESMIDRCAAAWAQPDQPPQCLIVLASRLPRLAWKYEGIAYKISLMNAGVVIQSLYLVCTDLGLNGSAAGSGRPDLFAAATGTSAWEETSIAEFGFGSRPAG